MAGAGGNGNDDVSEANGIPQFCTPGSSGFDGEEGEDCGNINIYNNITVFAYGGGGGSCLASKHISSPSRRRRIPSCWYRWTVVQVAEVVTMLPEQEDIVVVVAKPLLVIVITVFRLKVVLYKGMVGAYFESGEYGTWGYNTSELSDCYATIGGQGGHSLYHNSYSGDGGAAGKGGIVTKSRLSYVYAYNGNKYTDGQVGHEYMDGDNQLEIYAQNGNLREVRKYSTYFNSYQDKRNISYFKSLLGKQVNQNIDSFTANANDNGVTHSNYIIREAFEEDLVNYPNRIIKSGYSNPETGSVYGVGSGAGYIEISNGTYTVDTTGKMD